MKNLWGYVVVLVAGVIIGILSHLLLSRGPDRGTLIDSLATVRAADSTTISQLNQVSDSLAAIALDAITRADSIAQQRSQGPVITVAVVDTVTIERPGPEHPSASDTIAILAAEVASLRSEIALRVAATTALTGALAVADSVIDRQAARLSALETAVVSRRPSECRIFGVRCPVLGVGAALGSGGSGITPQLALALVIPIR